MVIRIEPSGVVMVGVCEIQSPYCQAVTPASITAVWKLPGRIQVNVCRPCLEEMVREGKWEILGARVPVRYDIAVYGNNAGLALAVEVKSNAPRRQVHAEKWAINIHRNLIMHVALPVTPYFLLVGYPGMFYLWTQYIVSDPYRTPDFAVQNENLLRSFMPASPQLDHKDSAYQQEQVVAAWLTYLTHTPEISLDPSCDWLRASGLLAAIQDGEVILQSASSERPRFARAS